MSEYLLFNGSTWGSVINGTTEYFAQVGTNQDLTTEAWAQHRVTDSYTLDQFHIFVVFNSISDGSTVAHQRIDGVNGNQAVTIAASLVGLFGDTTNNDAVVDTDLVNNSVAAGGSTGLIFGRWMSHVLDGDQMPYMGADGSQGRGTSSTGYHVLSGDINADSETNHNSVIRVDTTFTDLGCFITVNGVSDPTTVKLRVDGADGNQLACVLACQVGRFEDTTNNDAVLADSDVVYEMAVGMGSHTDTSVVLKTNYVNGESTTQRLITAGGGGQGVLSANTVEFATAEGPLNIHSTESETRSEIRSTQTFDQLKSQCRGFGLDVTAFVAVNINGTVSSMSVTITATGIFTNTTDSESVVSGDDVGYTFDSTASSSGTSQYDRAAFNAGEPTDEVLAYGFWF